MSYDPRGETDWDDDPHAAGNGWTNPVDWGGDHRPSDDGPPDCDRPDDYPTRR